MKCGLIGTGRVGTAFFYWLKKSGFEITGIYDPNQRNVRKAESVLSGRYYCSPAKLLRRADCVFVATPDSEIKKVYKKIKPFLNFGSTLFHFSGSIQARILATRKIKQGSLHPLGTFPDYTGYRRLKFYYFGLEGDRSAIMTAKKILNKIGAKSFVLKPNKKILYHLASVFGSNLMVGLLGFAQDLAQSTGIKKKDFFVYFWPLIHGTISDIGTKGLRRALSGPVERADVETIIQHQRVLRKASPDMLKVYNLISKKLARISQRKSRRKLPI